MGQFGVGQSVPRAEDNRFIIGEGTYTDDINLDNQAHAYFVRSPMAHADIVSLDVSAAKSAPGVLAVYTGRDDWLAQMGDVTIGPMFLKMILNKDGSEMHAPPRPVITGDRVRFVGDIYAVIIAESIDLARDAEDLIEVEFAELPVETDTENATSPNSPAIWEGTEANICFHWANGDEEKTNAVFANAKHITKVKLINNRVVVNSMEPRNFTANYDAARSHYTVYTGSQGVTGVRQGLAGVLGMKEENVRVITMDTGGGFGMKTTLYPEYPVVCWAAKELGRPVKWNEDRSEAFLADAHGRDHVTNAELAIDGDNKFLGVRVHTIAGMGAYLSPFGPLIPTMAPAGMHTGAYVMEGMHTEVTGVFTNTTPTSAYRGAGRPEAAYVIERLVDKAAGELGLGPDELRRLNFVKAEQMPYTQATGVNFDSGDFAGNMDDALKAADWAGYETRAKEREARGLLSGIGLTYYVERTAAGGEIGRIEVRPDGEVIVYIGTQNHGQGHETTWAQLISDRLGVPFDAVTVAPGDSDLLSGGGGTGGSRSGYMGGGALHSAADTVIERGKELAANELEAAEADIEFQPTEGKPVFAVAGTDRTIGLFEVAELAARQPEIDGLLGDGKYKQQSPTYPNGCHICEVEIDPETGTVRLDRYTVVDDFGKLMNPLIVAGQVHGGIAQGLGQAMGERCVYDPDSGQFLTATFMDYWMPRADDMPSFDVHYNEIPSTTNAMGVKGCGEAGTIGACPVYINAVVNALKGYGVDHIDMPVTPQKVWAITNKTKAA